MSRLTIDSHNEKVFEEPAFLDLDSEYGKLLSVSEFISSFTLLVPLHNLAFVNLAISLYLSYCRHLRELSSFVTTDNRSLFPVSMYDGGDVKGMSG